MLKIFSPLLREDHLTWMKLQTSETIRERVLRLLLCLLLICGLHSIAMMLFEDLSLPDALWLTFTTVTTVGYGDISASTYAGRISTIFMMYFIGISLLAQVAGEFIEYRLERRTRMIIGQWRWRQMENHILIINVPNVDSERYLRRLVRQIRTTPSLKDIRIQILTTAYPDGLPIALREQGVVHRNASPVVRSELDICNASQAHSILILAADSFDPQSDAITLNILLHLQELGIQNRVLAEAVMDENRERFLRFGAQSVLRPIRAYPEILVRALVAPGSEVILEDLFTYGGVYPKRVDLSIEGRWGDIAAKLIHANLGIPLGYISIGGHVISSPDVENDVQAKAILLMVTDNHVVSASTVENALKTTSPA